MKHTIFKGMATALVTPMTETGVDYPALEKLVNWQIEEGVHALVVIGTTGEATTLSAEEKRAVVRCVVQTAAHRVPVIAGTGANCTAHAIENTRMACEEGVDAVLVVTPYYNKATQSGLVAHFTAVADASTVPVILYNVPGRTGCNLLPATVKKLASHEKIVGVKEASGNMAQVVELMALCGDQIDVYSGEDALTVAMMAMGGAGCISVLSNVVPRMASEMTNKFFAGDLPGAAKLQLDMLPLVNCLFSQVNPIPAKAAVAKLGICQDILRLPLTPMEEPFRSKLYEEMRKLGIEV